MWPLFFKQSKFKDKTLLLYVYFQKIKRKSSVIEFYWSHQTYLSTTLLSMTLLCIGYLFLTSALGGFKIDQSCS